MKNNVKKASLVMLLLVLIGQFASCKKEKKVAITNTTTVAEVKEEPKAIREPIVFITGVDKGNSTFYQNARNYFIEKEFEVVDNAFSLEEIINWLNKNYDERLYGEVHIVSANNPWKGMSLETIIQGEKITTNSLTKNAIEGKLPTLENVISDTTKFVFHANELGKDEALLKMFKNILTTNKTPSVVASPYYTIFGNDSVNQHLAKAYYAFYPTANSPGKVDLSKEFAKTYPEEKDIDWLETLYNYDERYVGEAFTTKFNIPIEWEIDFSDSDDDMPTFKIPEEIMDWIEGDEKLSKEFSNYNIPLEKFRWKSYVKGRKLIIKGKTTVVCILKSIIKPYGDLEYVVPEIDNLRLYTVE